MTSTAGSSQPAATMPGADRAADSPFRGSGLLARAAPFAIVAVLAEASLALPPGPASPWPVVASIVLLLAVAAAFALPWSRLPRWMPVLVPLAYTGSVLALILAAGTTSGVGVVILVPLIWTALFHRPWESACIVAAIVAVEVIISLTPVAVPDAVIVRRVLLWAMLGTLISVATHGLRDRIRRSAKERDLLQDRLRRLTVIEDRDRIAAELQDKVIQQVFAAGLNLQAAASLAAEPEVRRRVETSVDDLDRVVRVLRDTIFGLQPQPQRRGLRHEILALCGDVSPAPEIRFRGPVDGALHPGAAARVVEILRDALTLIGQRSAVCVDITAGDDTCVTVIEAVSTGQPAEADGPAPEFTRLRDNAARAGIRVHTETIPGGTRLSWRVPLNLQAHTVEL